MALVISDGTPAGALALVAPRVGREIDEMALHDRFFRHPSPQSLKALVEIAAEIGLRARAFRAEPENLQEIELPAIVHFDEAGGESGGFAVLLGHDNGRFVLEEGSAGARQELSADEFRKSWSGIVVTIDVDAEATAVKLRRAGPLARLRRRLATDELVGPLHDGATRLLVPALAVLALAWTMRAATTLGSAGYGLALAVLVLLTVVGLSAARELFLVSHRAHVPDAARRLSAVFCRKGSRADCEGVLASRYASFFGVSLAGLGLALLASNLAMFAVGAVLPGGAQAALLDWLALAHLLAVPGSLWLIGVQVYPLRRFCPLCMICHAPVVAGAILGALWLSGSGALASAGNALAFAALHAVAFAGGAGLAVSVVALAMEVRSHRTRLGWIGATPWGAVAEMLGRPPLPLPDGGSPIHVGLPQTPLRLDALVHPVCSGCESVVKEIEQLVAQFPELVACTFYIPPRDLLSEADARLCASFYAVARMAGGPRALAYFMEVKKQPWAYIARAEADMPGMIRELFQRAPDDEAMARARADVDVASAFYEATQRGTPVVLLEGRPWESSLGDLAMLLERHPDRLLELLEPQGTRKSRAP